MRTCHVIGSIDPAMGGPPLVALHLACAQAQIGMTVHVFCHEDPARSEFIDQTLASFPGTERLTFHRIPLTSKGERITAAAAMNHLRTIVSDIDLFQIHGVWEPILFRTATVARNHDTPYVIMPHGMLDVWSMAQSRLKKQVFMKLFISRMIARAGYLHALNHDEVTGIESLGLKLPPIKVIPNGIWFEEFAELPDPGPFRTAHPELGDAPYLLFLSRLHHKKGLDLLAEAFGLLAKTDTTTHLVVAGPEEDQSAADFRQRIDRLGVGDRVHLVGPQYQEDKHRVLAGALGFVLPSRQEGFSLAITEALACGLPVVITPQCHFPEVAEADAGLIAELDAAPVAEAMAKLTADPAAAAQMGQRGRALVQDRYQWPRIAEMTRDAYQPLV